MAEINRVRVMKSAKRLADYCRLSMEVGTVKKDSAIAVAYLDFMEEWKAWQEAEDPS